MVVNFKFKNGLVSSGTLRDKIIVLLGEKPLSGSDIVVVFCNSNNVTPQAVYKALRVLVHEEIIVKEKQLFTLNALWLSHMRKFIDMSEYILGVHHEQSFFDPLSKSRQITLRFKNTELLDIYCGHLLLTLFDRFKGKPIFFYNHHEWFIYDRPLSENYLYEKVAESGHRVFLTLGADTSLARSFRKKFEKGNIQITIDESFSIPITDYICIIGEYIITARYDRSTVQAIDNLFKVATFTTEDDSKKLRKILDNCTDARIIINRNNKRAQKLRKKLAKNFIIKKEELE